MGGVGVTVKSSEIARLTLREISCLPEFLSTRRSMGKLGSHRRDQSPFWFKNTISFTVRRKIRLRPCSPGDQPATTQRALCCCPYRRYLFTLDQLSHSYNLQSPVSFFLLFAPQCASTQLSSLFSCSLGPCRAKRHLLVAQDGSVLLL